MVHSFILENRYGFRPNQNIVLSGNYSLTDYRTDSVFTAAEDKNNEAQGLTVAMSISLIKIIISNLNMVLMTIMQN